MISERTMYDERTQFIDLRNFHKKNSAGSGFQLHPRNLKGLSNGKSKNR